MVDIYKNVEHLNAMSCLSVFNLTAYHGHMYVIGSGIVQMEMMN